MKKYVFPAIYVLITTFFIVYANIKASEADKLHEIAERAVVQAERNASAAERLEKIAEESAARARIEENRATQVLQELEDCKTAKK